MSMNRDQLYQAALGLQDSDRLELAGQLMETISITDELWEAEDPEFLAELDRRSEDQSLPIPWAQVRAELESHESRD